MFYKHLSYIRSKEYRFNFEYTLRNEIIVDDQLTKSFYIIRIAYPKNNRNNPNFLDSLLQTSLPLPFFVIINPHVPQLAGITSSELVNGQREDDG